MSSETAIGSVALFLIAYFLAKKESTKKFILRATLVLLVLFALRFPDDTANGIEAGASATMGVLGRLANTIGQFISSLAG
jgi:hypothetical protein